MGKEIKERIQEALQSDNFKKLNETISKTVNQALDDIRKNSSRWHHKKKPRVKKQKDFDEIPYSDYETVESDEDFYNQENVYKEPVINQKKSVPKKEETLISKSPSGRISGMFLMILGNIGIGITIVITLLMTLFASLTADILVVIGYSSLVLVPLLIGFAAMVGKGSSLRNRYKRFKQYVLELGDKTFLSIDTLVKSVNRSRRFVIKDLRKMIAKEMFPKGQIDRAETLFFLDESTYEEHEKMLEGLRLQEEENEKQLEAMRQKGRRDPIEKAVLDVVREGKTTIRQINEANCEIKGEIISKKLLRLEIVITKIFKYIEENPDEILEIRKFMDYYLPTTLKLVTVYRELESESFQGPTIRATKKEIEETLDTINDAFENLFDSFFEETAMDISSDISVLNTLLAQEGLTKSDFEQGEKNG